MFCKKCGRQLNDGAMVCPNCGTRIQYVSVEGVFSMYAWKHEGELNDCDCFAGRIPEDVKGSVRQNFGIDFSEDVLFVRDTSFWNSRDQGLVITSSGVYCIPDNDSPDDKIAFSWDIVKNVIYKDSVLYFFGYGDETDYCQIHISFFMKDDDDRKAYRLGNKLAQMFTSMAQSIEPEADPFDEAWNYYQQLGNEGKIDEALRFALSCKDKEGLEAFHLYAGACYGQKGDYKNAIAIFDEGLTKCEPQSPLATWLYYYKYSWIHASGNDAEARKFILPVIQNATEDMKRDDGLSIREDAMNDLEACDKEYVAHFLEQPYNRRKVLLPVNSYTDLSQNHLNVIDIKKLDCSGISFPIGHPVAYQLYVGHPYVAQKYLPFDSYELELIEDKVREFCQLAQCLGATEISIESLNSSSSDQHSNTEQNVSGKVDYKFASASGSGNRNGSKHLIEVISQSINLHQKFKPNAKPYLPESLVWYPNEPSWQRLYEQRMHGALQQHEERIETRKSRVLEGTELNSIEGEFKNLLLSANGHWDKKMEEKFELQENAVLAIRVQFAPLNVEQGGSMQSPSAIAQYTENEKEYIEEVKTCLAESGDISASERRLLERLRKHLGISEERASELEESLSPTLTDEEKNYLDEYRLCLEDGGSISTGERRLLDKFRIRLGISEERVKEIENMV